MKELLFKIAGIFTIGLQLIAAIVITVSATDALELSVAANLILTTPVIFWIIWLNISLIEDVAGK